MTACERCYLRPPRPASWRDIEETIQEAPRSRFPLLAFGWAPYPDDPDHGTLYLEIAANRDAEFEDPGHEWLFGGVGLGSSHGPFDWREVSTTAQGVRLHDASRDGDLEAAMRTVEAERRRSGIWMH